MKPEKRALTLWAAAKLNLTLAVHPARSDGYHELESVMHKLSLYDTLTFRRAQDVTLQSDLEYLPTDERNLCVRAARGYFERKGLSGGVSIRVRKAIPVAAGLGGGSADAAVTLRALETLYGPLEESDRSALALQLGADVPFCLESASCCLCEGIGERISVLESGFSPSPVFLLVKTERKLSTAQVYQDFDSAPPPAPRDQSALLRAVAKGDLEAMCEGLFNDLEQTVFARKPALLVLRDRLLSLGARAAHLCGAGPTVYGVFADETAARAAAAHFSTAPFCRLATLR